MTASTGTSEDAGDGDSLRRTLGEIEEQVAELTASDGSLQEKSELGEDLDGVVSELTARLATVEEELQRALGVLAESRSDLRQLAEQRLPDTQEKLAEANSATEVAASRMMDRLERALELVSELDLPAGTSGQELEQELHEVINSLQFQDITSQQIRHVSTVLRDTERRLGSLASVLFGEERTPDSGAGANGVGDGGDDHAFEDSAEGDGSFDPDATTDGASDRQDVADEVFG